MDVFLRKIRNGIDLLNARIGRAVSWLTLALVILVCINVVMRYVFSISLKWENELEWHIFSLIFLLAGGYSLLEDKHVSVDVFYTKFSPRNKALTDFVGTLIFLLPWSAIIIYYSFWFFLDSYQLGEGSPDPGGLKAWYWIKLAIPLGFSLLFLQGVSMLIKAYLALRTGDYSEYINKSDIHQNEKI